MRIAEWKTATREMRCSAKKTELIDYGITTETAQWSER